MSTMSTIATALLSLANGEGVRTDELKLVKQYVDQLLHDEPAQRFPHIQGGTVVASFYQRDNDRFVIIVEDKHRSGYDKYVVAYVRNLTDHEWDQGHYCDTFDKALDVWHRRVGFVPMPLPVGSRDRHDYEPGDTTHPMSTDPACRICGETRRTCEQGK